MKKFVQILLLVFCVVQLSAQDFTGQWKGEFIDKSTAFTGWGGDRCEYVLEIECKANAVTGYSYTYFSDGGKRYYTICKLAGTVNRASKYIELKEIERTKTNVPVNIRNCFQIHKLTYFQTDDEQSLEGNWVPVPNQSGDCGFGTTLLTKRILKRNPDYYNKPITKVVPKKKPDPIKKQPPVVKVQPKKTTPPVVKSIPKKPEQPTVIVEDKKIDKPETKVKDVVIDNTPPLDPVKPAEIDIIKPRPAFEKRNNELLKTIEIDNSSFTVALYDNGEIDGDSISLFFNGALLLSHQRLSDKAIKLKLDVDNNRDVNELVMYAENLGTIPPNTALMVVNDGDNRYEVRISSDLKKSGVIRFVHKQKPKQ